MKRIYSASDSVLVVHMQGLLEQEGIKTALFNLNMSTISGEVPFFSTFPELWVVNDEDEARAVEIIRQSQTQVSGRDSESVDARSSWECPSCGSLIERQFTECWKCSGEDSEG